MHTSSGGRACFALIIISFLFSGCSGTDVLNTLGRASHYRAQTDIAYGDNPRQTMDIYRPQEANSCLVMFVYGGSWDSGKKEQYGFVGAALARRGYTVAIPDYRLYPEVTYSDFVDDIARAVASEPVQKMAEDKSLVLMGHSAGAMMAGLVSYDAQYLDAWGASRAQVDRYVSLAGPHDYFLPTEKAQWTRIFGSDKSRQVDALTVNHIHADNPPTLILHGADDETVTPKSAVSLEQKLQQAGVSAERKTYEGVSHVKLVAAMGRPLGFLAPTLEDIDRYLQPLCGVKNESK
ncbi:alpha/beta hydrolase [Gilvimarinus xylanilyticus]|uniref:Alpha/beta hydrolase n=1 Tax=Gilvimarinus xylanilyticus TaxID=2944139 RepID=A0A9X2KV18_9GAMM|nr:alpha/beta hydrolase [Gilvimarinus xylanilyticus]MCP8900448.1 alpha/beta hydrolase [Gilvimarinus xylanilyticus]